MVSSKHTKEEVDQPIIKAEEEDPIEGVIIIKIRIFIKVVIKQISLSLSLSLSLSSSYFRLNSITLNYAYIIAFSLDNLI